MNIFSPLQHVDVPHYCAAYKCENKKWTPDFQLCLCPNEKDFEKVDKTVDSTLPRCCPQTKFKYQLIYELDA